MKKLNNILLEAIQKGINLALDDIEDQNDIQLQTYSKIKNVNISKEYLDLMEYVVDLGLPSGTLWCKYNLGCNYDLLNNNPENTMSRNWYGDYYAWGKIKTQNTYTERTYKTNINLQELTSEYDAAYLNMHYKNYKFHIPTKKLFEELLKYTNIKRISDYIVNNKIIIGLSGWEFISKINNQKIFIPASGYGCERKNIIRWSGIFAGLWTSTNALYKGALSFILNKSTGTHEIMSSYRYSGFTIRPVLNL